MVKVYIEYNSKMSLGGGFTFVRNFKKALKDKVQFVDNWKDCDIIFIFGITAIDKGRVYEAINAGKKLVLRVDNIPRKSRNKRQSPAERLAEFGSKADMVVYQSQWCKEFAGYFIKNENNIIINNGVDTDIFNTKDRNSDGNTYLYCDYNPNPNKRIEEALYWFELEWRKNNKAKLYIVGNAPSIYKDNPDYNWDLNVPAEVKYIGVQDNPQGVANVMKECDYLLYPAFAEAYPNTLLEAMACGLEPVCVSQEGGAREVVGNSISKERSKKMIQGLWIDECFCPPKPEHYKVKTIQEMGEEYLEVFKNLLVKE